jgi:hypothetical protein
MARSRQSYPYPSRLSSHALALTSELLHIRWRIKLPLEIPVKWEDARGAGSAEELSPFLPCGFNALPKCGSNEDAADDEYASAEDRGISGRGVVSCRNGD